jgi:hypothetical protein
MTHSDTEFAINPAELRQYVMQLDAEDQALVIESIARTLLEEDPTFPTIEAELSLSGLSGVTLLELVMERVEERAAAAEEAARVPDLTFNVHRSTPPAMRNFISQVMPESVNDEVFSLGPIKSSLLTFALLDMYAAMAKSASSHSARIQRVEFLVQYVGLYDQPRDIPALARSKAISPTEVRNKINRVQKGATEEIDRQNMLEVLDIVQTMDREALLEYLEEYQRNWRSILRPEDEPIPEGYKRHIIKDSDGVKHVILWDEDKLEIRIDNTVYSASSRANVFADRIALVRCLLKNRKHAFSSSDFHAGGVARHGTQNDTAISQAVRQAVKLAEELVVETPKGPVPVIIKASARKYQLHQALGGPSSKPVKKSINESEGNTIYPNGNGEREDVVYIQDKTVYIEGVGYRIRTNLEGSHVRLLIESNRTMGLEEITQALKRRAEVTDREMEESEEVLYELSKRGIVLRLHGRDEDMYKLNRDITGTLSELTLVEYEAEVLYFNDFDLQALKVLMNSGVPLSISKLAYMMDTNGLDADDYDNLAFFVKKYLYPHAIVRRDTSIDGTHQQFFIPTPIKQALRPRLPILD